MSRHPLLWTVCTWCLGSGQILTEPTQVVDTLQRDTWSEPCPWCLGQGQIAIVAAPQVSSPWRPRREGQR